MRVLFAVKLTEPPEVARKVEALCELLEADLYVVHVGVAAIADLAGLGDSGMLDMYAETGVGEGVVDRLAERRPVLDEFVRRNFRHPVKTMVYEGSDVPSTIAETADRIGADMVVIGHKPHALIGRMVGGLADRLVSVADIPTLLIPIRTTS